MRVLVMAALLGLSSVVSAWQVIESRDEMTDEVSVLIGSGYKTSSKSSWDVKAGISVDCDTGYVMVLFTPTANLVGGEIGSRSTEHRVYVRFDDYSPYHTPFKQPHGSRFMFNTSFSFLEQILSKKMLRMSVNWYMEGAPVFKFDLTGLRPLYDANCTKIKVGGD